VGANFTELVTDHVSVTSTGLLAAVVHAMVVDHVRMTIERRDQV